MLTPLPETIKQAKALLSEPIERSDHRETLAALNKALALLYVLAEASDEALDLLHDVRSQFPHDTHFLSTTAWVAEYLERHDGEAAAE